MVFGDDQLLVIEKPRDSALDEIVIPFENLVQVDLATILLYGYVCFHWIAGNALQTLKIEYNNLGDLLMRAEVERLRIRIRCPEGDAAVLSQAEWTAILKSMPLKFAYYLQYALFPGEVVLRVIFQPTINPKRRSRASEDRTLALTSEGMIVLEAAREFSNYGMVIRYFPIGAIRGIRFEPASDQVWLRLSLGAAGIAEETALPLSGSNASSLCDALRRFTPSIPILWASEAAPSPVGAAR